jgi:hypothetical protein
MGYLRSDGLLIHQCNDVEAISIDLNSLLPASIMASATPSASVPGKSTSAPEARTLEDPAALRSSVRLTASKGHACTKTNYTSCLPSSSVTNSRSMLESCDNCARSEKSNGQMFRSTPSMPTSTLDGAARVVPPRWHHASRRSNRKWKHRAKSISVSCNSASRLAKAFAPSGRRTPVST